MCRKKALEAVDPRPAGGSGGTGPARFHPDSISETSLRTRAATRTAAASRPALKASRRVLEIRYERSLHTMFF